jgi:hypothetical protein
MQADLQHVAMRELVAEPGGVRLRGRRLGLCHHVRLLPSLLVHQELSHLVVGILQRHLEPPVDKFLDTSRSESSRTSR